MSVTPMKLVTFAGALSQFDAVVRECVVNQQVHLEHVLQLMKDVRGLRPFPLSNPYAGPLRRAEEVAQALGITPRYACFESHEELSPETASAYLDDMDRHLNSFRKRQDTLEREAADAQMVIGQLENLRGLSTDLHQLTHVEFVRFRYGYLPRETYNSFQAAIHSRENAFFIPTEVGLERVYGIYFTTKAAKDQVDALFNSMHFVRIMIDERVQGSPEQAIAQLSQQADAARSALLDLQQERAAFQEREQARFLVYWSYLRFHNDCFDVRRYAACSRDSFYLMGWVPIDCVEEFCARLKRFPGLSCVVDDAGDLEHITPPTKLRDGFFARIFQPFLAMYGLPNYREVDPSLFMSITYVLFFGIMFGDIGQGLVLALVGFWLAKKKKNWLGNIIICCGLSGAIFGCVYGSVFGFEELLPGFKVLHGGNVTTLLILSLGLGVLMIAFVMVLNIINGVKQKNWEKILFGPNGAAGMVFYLGLIIAALVTLFGGVNLFIPAYVLPVLVLPLVLILLREPLSRLLAGDPHWNEASWGAVIGFGFFELFETLLSYLTNTLSFLRVAAYAITHVGLMLVIQALAGSDANPVVLVLGNVFVIGFEGLLVGIQVLRLEFYELFGRFYEDGGQEYKPKVIDYTATGM